MKNINTFSDAEKEIKRLARKICCLQSGNSFPLMTSDQRLAIINPSIGLHIYQIDGTEGVYVNKSTGWVLAY